MDILDKENWPQKVWDTKMQTNILNTLYPNVLVSSGYSPPNLTMASNIAVCAAVIVQQILPHASLGQGGVVSIV